MTAIAHGRRSGAIAFDFYSWMAVACMAVAVLGFVPTYWMPMAEGYVAPRPIVHLHALVFFSWTIFFVVQSALVPGRRVALHRSVGLAGIALGTVVTMMGLIISNYHLRRDMSFGLVDSGKSFLIVDLVNIATFAVFFTLSIANIRRPDHHKRYMLLAGISLLLAPIARPLIVWILPIARGTEVPSWIYIPAGWLSYLLIVVAMMYDWRTIGRPHRIYMIALPILLAVSVLVVPISHTAAWHAFARGFAELPGPLPIKPV